jgi:hypothetical protein
MTEKGFGEEEETSNQRLSFSASPPAAEIEKTSQNLACRGLVL